MVSAVSEELKTLVAKSVEIASNVATCREQMAMVRKEQESAVNGKNMDDGTSRGESESVVRNGGRSSDIAGGLNVSGEEATWLRLL